MPVYTNPSPIPEYHKINTCFKRDTANKNKIMLGEWSDPVFEYLQDNLWAWTEKVDGTNIRIHCNRDAMGDLMLSFRGRTDSAQIPGGLVNRLNLLFHTQERIDQLANMFPDGDVTLFGEGYGAKIQKGGGNYKATQDFVLFDIKVGPIYLERHNVEDIAEKLGLDVVPILSVGTLNEAIESARLGVTSWWGDFLAEGYVLRPVVEMCDRRGRRVITKIKHCDFLGL